MNITATKHANLFILFILIFTTWTELSSKEHKELPYTTYVNEINKKFVKQISKEYGFKCEAQGGSMPYDVEEMSLTFAACQQATVEQARELEVKITEQFIQMINSHEKIRPFLREYPFSSHRARIAISFYQPNCVSHVNQTVTYVSNIKNKIHYATENPKNPYIYDTIKEEPYEEALRIVQSKSLSLPKINKPS